MELIEDGHHRVWVMQEFGLSGDHGDVTPWGVLVKTEEGMDSPKDVEYGLSTSNWI